MTTTPRVNRRAWIAAQARGETDPTPYVVGQPGPAPPAPAAAEKHEPTDEEWQTVARIVGRNDKPHAYKAVTRNLDLKGRDSEVRELVRGMAAGKKGKGDKGLTTAELAQLRAELRRG